MRKFLFATVALTGVLVATSAQAKDWFAIDHVNARCEQGLGKDPVEVQNYVRSQSFVPHVTVTRDDNNLVRHVKISWRGVNQEDSVVDMFSYYSDCKAFLDDLINSGSVVDPHEFDDQPPPPPAPGTPRMSAPIPGPSLRPAPTLDASTDPVAQAFLAGVADRTSFEDWIAGLKGMTLQGANAWAAHRSDKSPLPKPSCPPASAYGVDFTAGCVQAKAILDPDDASRLADSSYRAGWNSIP